MHLLPTPDQIKDPSDLNYHWVWLDLFIQRAMTLAPFPGDHVPDESNRYGRLKTMVEAAEAIARRILIIIALTLAPTPKRAATSAPISGADTPSPTLLPTPSTASGQPKDPPPMISMVEPFPNSPARAALPKCTTTSAPRMPKPQILLPGETQNWTYLMLRLAICRRLVLNPIPAAKKMRARMDSFAPLPPVPLVSPPRLARTNLDADAAPLATILNTTTIKALYPSGLPPG